MGLLSRIFSRNAAGSSGESPASAPPSAPTVLDSPEARSGIIARLRQMYRGHEPMTQVQLDLCVIQSFGLCRVEGLHEFLASNGWFLPVLPDAMKRHGLVRLAAVLEEVRLLLPPEAKTATREQFDKQLAQLLRSQRDALCEYDAQLEQLDEDHDAVVDLIFRQRWSELPEPLEMTPGWHGINPFTGEPTYFKPKYPL